ncbi:hypothetical protein [Hymenobacter sp. AT01-02]|uniref:hypothetical protein n=1 Tax=Hymenobacter sp. AT01-02 TaxID=1571877 RepID=UPI0005F249F0|nr:hypothetical protein [Hymenobacter sp. AT01-02]
MHILYVPEQQGQWDKGGFFLRALVWVLRRVLPQGSPDYHRRAQEVAYWLVEVDDDGWAEREIGFNAQHRPILFAPTDRNMGMWTDSDRVFSLKEFEPQNEYPFAATWNALYEQTL